METCPDLRTTTGHLLLQLCGTTTVRPRRRTIIPHTPHSITAIGGWFGDWLRWCESRKGSIIRTANASAEFVLLFSATRLVCRWKDVATPARIFVTPTAASSYSKGNFTPGCISGRATDSRRHRLLKVYERRAGGLYNVEARSERKLRENAALHCSPRHRH